MDHPSVKKLASTVKTVRDCLRKVGITDMDSMMHNVLFVAARMLDLNTCKHLAIAPTYQWDNIMKKIADKDTEGADKLFKSILNMLDTHFGLNGFPYSLSSVDDFVIIMKAYASVDIHEAAKHTDVLGYIYEQHLSTGSGSGRDLGKFYTDRQITLYLTELLGLEISSTGRPDSMCDATMGTGGFILSYIDLVHKANPNVKWDSMDLAGGDIDDKVAAIARLNVFIRTGKIFPMIRQRNTLKNDICDSEKKTERRTFDRLLMNIPFGVKGLTLADDCCTRVKDIVKAGTKSEPLFMALTCQLLAEGGKAAVIVPDGVLVNSSKQHDAIRKYLLDNFKVQRIIKMRGKFFMNTGIQPSVIVFERSGKTDEVEFWDVEKKETGELVEKYMLTVSREKFDASCSFDMRRYQEVKVVANPAGYETLKLGDLFEVKGGKAISKANLTGTLYPYYGCNGINGHVDEFLFDGEYIVCAQDGSIGSVYLLNEKFYPSNHTHILKTKDDTKITNAYGAYFLKMKVDWKSLTTSIIPKVTQGNLLEIKIIVPPLETQQEIVATLDRIYAPGTTELAETLKLTDKAMDLVLANPGGASLEPIVEAQRLMRKSAQMVADVKAQMVADVKAQMVAVVKAINMRCKEWTTIGNLYNTPQCRKKFNSKEMDNTGDVPFFNGKFNSPIGNHSDYSFDSDTPYFVMIKDGGGDHSSDSVGMGKFFNVIGKSAITSHNLVLTPKTENNLRHRFMGIYLRCLGKELRDKAKYSISLGSISVKNVLEFPIPNLTDTELSIANIRLELLQTQLSSLENLGKQAEDNARFILDSYLNTA
jgi:restriction endonuclease S subunit